MHVTQRGVECSSSALSASKKEDLFSSRDYCQLVEISAIKLKKGPAKIPAGFVNVTRISPKRDDLTTFLNQQTFCFTKGFISKLNNKLFKFSTLLFLQKRLIAWTNEVKDGGNLRHIGCIVTSSVSDTVLNWTTVLLKATLIADEYNAREQR